MFSRRLLLRSTAIAGAAALPLGGCGIFNNSTPDANVAKVADYVSTFANGLLSAFQQLGNITIPGITQAAITTAGTYIGYIQSLAQQVASAASTAAQQPLVQKIVTYANTVFNTLQPVLKATGLGTVADILQAAEVFLPLIMSLVGLAVPASTTARTAAITARTSINQDQALLILKRAAHQLH